MVKEVNEVVLEQAFPKALNQELYIMLLGCFITKVKQFYKNTEIAIVNSR